MRRVMLLVPALLFLVGCGGGGSSVRQDAPPPVADPGPDVPDPSPSPTTPEPPPARPDPDTSEIELRQEFAAHPEFRNQPALEQVKAHYAYARGATGEGITLGIVDDGVDPTHVEFEGKQLQSSYSGDYSPDFGSCASRDADGTCVAGGPPRHGTLVAGIMAAQKQPTVAGNSISIHGVAFDAGLVSVGVPLSDPPEFYEPVVIDDPGLFDLLDREFAGIYSTMNPSVTAINLSLGLPGSIENYTEAQVRSAFPRIIDAIAQADTPASERTIYVWAAGNANGALHANGTVEDAASVEIMPGLPLHAPELRGHSLAVVATDQNGVIVDFSSRCGIAGDFCLAAPGVGLTGPTPGSYCPPGPGDCYATEVAGTSMAAPIVTGGIALLAQHYRGQLGNDELVDRLLQTADKTGIYADTGIYGQGFLDLDAATRPVGETAPAGRTIIFRSGGAGTAQRPIHGCCLRRCSLTGVGVIRDRTF